MCIRALTRDEQLDDIADRINDYALRGDPVPLWLHSMALGAGVDVQAILDNPQE